MVKFNRTTGSPKVRSIRLNGRKICSEDTTSRSHRSHRRFETVKKKKNFILFLDNNSVYESPSGSQRPDGIGRPDPEFGEVYNNGNGDEYPTNSNNNYQSTGGSVGGWQSNSGGDNAIRPKPGIATTAAEDLVQPPSVGKPNKATNRGSHETGSDGGGNDRPSNPNMLSLQASSTDSTRNDKQQISGVIDQILSNASTNKTVIIAVINNNNENYQEPSQDRPTGNDRVAATDNASGQSKPVSKNNSNKSPDQQSGSNSKPNQKRGNDLSRLTHHFQQLVLSLAQKNNERLTPRRNVIGPSVIFFFFSGKLGSFKDTGGYVDATRNRITQFLSGRVLYV